MSIKTKVIQFNQIIKNLDLDASISSFNDRKRIQKIFYFLKKLGLNFDIEYKWYIYGPYSNQLTEIYFQAEDLDEDTDLSSISLDEKDLENIKKVNTILVDINDHEKLEYYASILFIWKDMVFIRKKKDESTIKETIRELKPELYSKYSYKEAVEYLKNWFDLKI